MAGETIFATSPGDDEGIELAKSWSREKGLTSKEASIKKYPFSVTVEMRK